MNAEIIAVGSELLLGQIANTNGKFISEQLAELGINVFFHTVVGDNPTRLEDSVNNAVNRANLVVLTGGLGPTKDDLTKETVAKLLNTRLVYHEESLHNIKSYFKQTKRDMTENNKKQALVFENATVFSNDHGMAPGMAIIENECVYILLPGPPSEMKPMFQNYVIPYLLSFENKDIIRSRVLRFFGIGESLLETRIQDLIDTQSNPTIAPLAGNGEVTLRLTAKYSTKEEADRQLDSLEYKIRERVGDYFYGYDSTSLQEVIADKLKDRNLTISSAESITGGLFASELTAIPGASNFFCGGMITYTNETKQTMLQVSNETLVKYGAISKECAKEMAEKVRLKLNSDFGISFTGVAGPAYSEGREPGTVFIAISSKEETRSYELSLSGTRKAIQTRSVKYGLYYLGKILDAFSIKYE